ncbi:Alpha/Beta hydrolase protein [Armillaria mellea]|nr:Alpha/Beta hydrolase protein [Armillaria mellea]
MLIGTSVLCFAILVTAAPEVQLGKTKLVGRDVSGLQQEFFGGQYGGGFTGGASSSYNGSNIVAQSVTRGTPIIYVNYNYRLGPLGFPQGQEADNRGQLNLGVRDVLTALEWVTIFGESAGAMLTNLVLLNSSISNFAWASVKHMVVTQKLSVLNHSVRFSESGSASSPVIYNASTRETTWQYFVAGTTGCELANTSAIYQGLLEAYALAIEDHAFYPALDGPSGTILPDLPTRLWAKGQFATIPFISGTNLDEGSPYGTGNETFGLPVGWKRVASMTGDLTFDAQRRTWTQIAAQAGVKAYGYQFAGNSSLFSPELGEFIYGRLNSSSEAPSTMFLAEMMIDYWISFATSLDPNDGLGTSRPFWPQYTPENEAC